MRLGSSTSWTRVAVRAAGFSSLARWALWAVAVLAFALPAAAQLEPGLRIKGHKDLDCQKCHISGSGISSNNCLSCHTHRPLGNRIRAGKGLHASAEVKDKGCEQCHLEHKGRSYDPIDWKPVGGLKRFNVNHGKYAGYDLEGAHRRVDCKDCHTATYKESGRTKFLGLDSDCLTCHEDVHRFRSTKRELLECKVCHTFDARTVAKADGLSKFNHGKIADFDLNGKHNLTKCVNCHTSTKSFKLQNRPDKCVDCHKDPHNNVYTVKSRDCASCHSDKRMEFSEKIKWNHGRSTKFVLKLAHKSLDCKKCHSPTSKDVPRQSCTTCHTEDSAHVVAGKDRFDGRDCGECHSDNRKDFTKDVDFNHLKGANFNLAGAHGKLKCTECHRVKKDAKVAKKPDETFEFFKSKDCISCHAHGDEHNGQFNDRPQLCSKCHKAGFIPGPNSPLPPHGELSPVFAQIGAHAPISCDKCHGDKLAKLDLGDDCAACHKEDDAHAGNLGTTCKQCHYEGFPWSDVIFNHNAHASYKLEGKHQAVACDKCHTDAPKTFKPTDTACITCHQEQDVHQGKLGTDCVKCHDMHGTTAKFDHNTMTKYVLEGSHARADCAGCHFDASQQASANLDYTFATQGTLCRDCHGDPHGLRPGAECIGCHDLESWDTAIQQIGAGDADPSPRARKQSRGKKRSKGGKNKGEADGKVPNPDAGPGEKQIFKTPDHGSPAGAKTASSSESSGGVTDAEAAQPVRPASFTAGASPDRYHDQPPFSLREGHARVDCARCHGGRGDMQGFGKLCDTCHRQEDIHAGSLGGTCADCHSQRSWFPSFFSHTTTSFPLVGPHRLISCKQCHGAGNYMGLSGSCVSCHFDDAIRAQATTGVPHAGFVDQPCVHCHNQISWTQTPFLRRRF